MMDYNKESNLQAEKYAQPFHEMYMGENSNKSVEDIEEEENNFE